LVDLGDRFFSYTQEGSQQIYDFANKRIITVDLATKRYSDDSLFSDLGFRVFEFQNRLGLSGIIATAKISDNPMTPVLSEHLFALQQKDKKSELSQTEKDDWVSFSADGKELLSYSKGGQPVSSEKKEMFIKMIRYIYGGHPQILAKMASDNFIPRSITIHRYNILNEIYNLKISDIENTPAKFYSLEGYEPKILSADTDKFSDALNKIKHKKDIDLEKHLKLIESKIKEYLENNNNLDAMLIGFEYSLTAGLSLPVALQDRIPDITKDESVKKLLLSLNSKSKDQAKINLDILQNLEKETVSERHTLKIFEANHQMILGKYDAAKELFQEVLKHHPYITGAYKDLGGLYHNEYNMVMAWRCWDVARKIVPTHNMLNPIKEMESEMMNEYPEFF
jgi:tetratricopeptide (TPR) repeat protein